MRSNQPATPNQAQAGRRRAPSLRSGCAGSTPITLLDKRSQTTTMPPPLRTRGPAPVSRIAAAVTRQVMLSTTRSVHEPMRGTRRNPPIRPPGVGQTHSKSHADPKRATLKTEVD